MIRSLPILLTILRVLAHGDHSFDLSDTDAAGLSYAERHMHTEHHIDSFDLESFFQLHDLDMNGFWDQLEIQAVYGLHHHSVNEKIPEQEKVDERTLRIVNKVLQALDTNEDGKISLGEFMAGGKEGLPSFEGYKDLGHHYDEESEYFLHHEELYHSTPETQTDESYIHAEGKPPSLQSHIEHFQHHAEIEDEEDARERKFEGLSEDADLSKDHVVLDPLDVHVHASGEGPAATVTDPAVIPAQAESTLKPGDEVDAPPRPKRVDPGASPQRITHGGRREELADLNEVAKGQPGYGGGRPRSQEERLRSGVPYKYKMRKGLRSDEF